MNTSISKARQLVIALMQSNVPVNLISSPGLGKSDLIRSIADEFKLKLIDLRLSTCDVTDLTGLPNINEQGRSVWSPNECFPVQGDKIPDGYEGWLLFLDEITNAPRAVQAAAYKLVLDRQVGMFDLHEKVIIVSAGNKVDDNAAVTEEMSTALKSRMAHINLEINVDDWLDWAMRQNVHHSITSFIEFKRTSLYNFQPNVAADTFPCPRTWGMVAKIVDNVGINNPALQDLVAATIGDGTAHEYMSFTKFFSNLPKFEDIVANPEKAKVPEQPGPLYAISGSIGSQIETKNASAVWKYVLRLPMEFQMCVFLNTVKRNPGLAANKDVLDWAVKFAPKILGQ